MARMINFKQVTFPRESSLTVYDVTRLGRILHYSEDNIKGTKTFIFEEPSEVEGEKIITVSKSFRIMDFNNREIGFEDTEEKAIQRFLELHPVFELEAVKTYIYEQG